MAFQRTAVDAKIGVMTVVRDLQHFPGLLFAQIRADALHVLDAPDAGDLPAFGQKLVDVGFRRLEPVAMLR